MLGQAAVKPGILAQLEAAVLAGLPVNADIASLPRAVWGNKKYIFESWASKKLARGRKSWVYLHGECVFEINANDVKIEEWWCCRRCDAKGRPERLWKAHSTTAVANHLDKYVSASYQGCTSIKQHKIDRRTVD